MHYYEVEHRSPSGSLISISYLRHSDHEAERTDQLYEVIRYTPEIGWSTATMNRLWGMHWVTTNQRGITVKPMTGLPEHVEAQLP